MLPFACKKSTNSMPVCLRIDSHKRHLFQRLIKKKCLINKMFYSYFHFATRIKKMPANSTQSFIELQVLVESIGNGRDWYMSSLLFWAIFMTNRSQSVSKINGQNKVEPELKFRLTDQSTLWKAVSREAQAAVWVCVDRKRIVGKSRDSDDA